MSSPRILRWLSATNNNSVEINELFAPLPKDSIVHPWISPTPSEMDMDFLTRFVPLKLTKDDKIEKLERDLNGVGAIKRDYIVDGENLDPSRAVYVGGTVVSDGGENSSPNVDRGISGIVVGGGGGSSPFVLVDLVVLVVVLEEEDLRLMRMFRVLKKPHPPLRFPLVSLS
ncbi:hypothetical protein FXO38_03520 [Capsicum annuum]|nr:hypothetical protein FXO38_03520 [Capsicum annuum]KAF3680168.1 hypothetical protein FXO37_03458 [Capsicum annuum]